MKKNKIFVFFFACLLSFITFDSLIAGETMYNIYAKRVNVRESPTTKSKIIGKLSANERVYVYEIKNKWAKVTFKGKTGYVYVYAKFLGKTKIYRETDKVDVGAFSYSALKSHWSNRKIGSRNPDAMYLVIKITIKNKGKKPRNIPAFKLIDENAAEYETSNVGFFLDNVISSLDSVNPGVQKEGFIIFDVPHEHKYKLVVFGKYLSSSKALIEISPEFK